jgi:predicted DNA-binding transcriptional regulator YafY
MNRITFNRHRLAIEEMFDICIECQRKGGYYYYIENKEVFTDNNLQQWMLDSLSISNMLMESSSLKNRIMLENIPSGQDFLATVLQAMKKSKILQVTYKGYWSEHEHTFPVAPYCVKLFHQRWYMVGNSIRENKIRVYSLDRVLEIQPIEKAFKYPADFSPEIYFEGYFGVIHDEDYTLENVKLKVRADQANYLRSLPMHHSQTETERNNDFSIFTLQIRPTYDFQQELLRIGDTLEVLEPLWLRNEIAEMIKRMWNTYKIGKK